MQPVRWIKVAHADGAHRRPERHWPRDRQKQIGTGRGAIAGEGAVDVVGPPRESHFPRGVGDPAQAQGRIDHETHRRGQRPAELVLQQVVGGDVGFVEVVQHVARRRHECRSAPGLALQHPAGLDHRGADHPVHGIEPSVHGLQRIVAPDILGPPGQGRRGAVEVAGAGNPEELLRGGRRVWRGAR